MRIGTVEVKVSIVAVAVFVFFTIFLLFASLYSPEVRSQLIWMIPALFLLLVIPMALNYMSRSRTIISSRSMRQRLRQSGSS